MLGLIIADVCLGTPRDQLHHHPSAASFVCFAPFHHWFSALISLFFVFELSIELYFAFSRRSPASPVVNTLRLLARPSIPSSLSHSAFLSPTVCAASSLDSSRFIRLFFISGKKRAQGIPPDTPDTGSRGRRAAIMTGTQNGERDKTRPLLPIPPPYNVLPNHERFRKTFKICGKWPWELVQEDKIPATWSVNLLDELAHAVRIVETTDVSLNEFTEQLNRNIEERIPLNKANWTKKLMKTDATNIIKWMTDKKKDTHQQDRTTRSKSQAPNVNRNNGSQDSRQSLSASTRSGKTPRGHDAPAGDKASATGHGPDSRGDEDFSQQNQNDTSSITNSTTAPALEKHNGHMTALSPMARLLTSVTNVDAAAPSRKRPRMCDSSLPDDTARKVPRSRKSDGGHRATTDAPVSSAAVRPVLD